MKGQQHMTQKCTSILNGRPHTGPSHQWPLKNGYHDSPKKWAPFLKKRKGQTNLLPPQQRPLSTLQQQDTFLIVPCDKNLGPAIIEHHDYLKIAMRDQLNDTTTYKLLDQSEIKRTATIVKKYCYVAYKTS